MNTNPFMLTQPISPDQRQDLITSNIKPMQLTRTQRPHSTAFLWLNWLVSALNSRRHRKLLFLMCFLTLCGLDGHSQGLSLTCFVASSSKLSSHSRTQNRIGVLRTRATTEGCVYRARPTSSARVHRTLWATSAKYPVSFAAFCFRTTFSAGCCRLHGVTKAACSRDCLSSSYWLSRLKLLFDSKWSKTALSVRLNSAV